MAQTALKEEVFEFPSGGIADFYMEDDEIAALEREEAEQAFGKAGIAEFGEVAARMASYGRGGDDTIAHVATGEIIIPLPLIDGNPKMKESIFRHLEDLGVEDPEQYVVGSSANSINPDTGLAEFGWLKKTFKKITKAVKKVAKSVVKVVKKASTFVLPIVGTMFLGPIYGAALGSGIATLLNGGDLKDAFKSALISGGTGALMSGVSGAISGDGFMSGVSNAANPANLTEGLSNIGKAFTGDFSGASFANMKGGPASEGGTNFAGTSDTALSTSPTGTPTSVADVSTAAIDPATGAPPVNAGAANNMSLSNYDTATGTFKTPPPPAPAPASNFMDTAKGYYDKSMDYLIRGGRTEEAVNLAREKAGQNYLKDMAAAKIAPTQAGLEAAKAAAGPGILATYGPSAALAGAGLYGAGFFDTPEDPPVDTPPTGEELIAADPEKYRVADLEVRRAEGPTEIASPYTIIPGQGVVANPFYRPPYAVQTAAEGGEIFPRRVGGIMPDEGIPGRDSVRAMLMPGEFVMTTDAVRGLGNGSERQGINNMYQMMRGLEARGRGMA